MVEEVKNNFAAVLAIIKQGEKITIRSSQKKENLAVLIPFSKYEDKPKRKLGLLESKASFTLRDDFKITDQELLSL